MLSARPTGRSTIRWQILALLFAASFVAYILRTNMSIAGERMMDDLGLTQVQLGMVLAAFAWGYAIFQFPGGVFGDRIGARRTLTITAVLWGVLNLLVGFVPGPALASPLVILGSLLVLRGLMGAVQAPLYPVTGGAMTCAWFPVSGWAFPNALTNAGLTLGSAAAGPLIAWLMETVGWRQSFILTAPLGLLLAGVWWWYARDTPAEHPRVHQAELELIDKDRPAFACVGPSPGAWKIVLRDPDVLLLALSYFCSNYVFYFFFNWLFIYLVDNRGFKVLESGFYAAAPWVTGAFGALLGGLICDRLSGRIGLRLGCRIPAMAGLLLAGAFILAAAGAVDPRLAVVLLSLCLAAQQLTEGAFWAGTIAVSGRHSSSACGILNTGGNIVGGVGALLVPITVERFGWPAALGTASVFALVGALLWLWIQADRKLAATS
jgi:ACS family glucarate transporter-like MFS transporter